MTTRTTAQTVTFQHPFRLTAADEILPMGRYVVETDEELVETLSFPVYRRISTFIRLPGRPGSSELSRLIAIDPAELAAALAADAGVQEGASANGSSAASGPARI